MPKPENDPPGAQRFAVWLSEVAKAARENAGASTTLVAAYAGVTDNTIRRFEKAANWPHDPDRVMAAYALTAGMPDSRQLYRDAIDLWYRHGSAPTVTPDATRPPRRPRYPGQDDEGQKPDAQAT